MKSPILTIMVGIPRSGKSTWSEKNKTPEDIIICPDTIRKEIFGHQFHQNAEPYIWAITETFMLLLMQQRKSIILDATNLSYRTRCKYINLAKTAYGYKTRLVWLNTDLKTCLERNKKSKDKKVPKDVIKTMYDFVKPLDLKYEGDLFDEILEVKNGKMLNHYGRI